MKRSIQKWQDSDPDYMVKKLSRLGLLSALRDAKADILELHAEVERLTAVAHAADDYLVGLKYEGFAEENGGIDELRKCLKTAVDKWTHE